MPIRFNVYLWWGYDHRLRAPIHSPPWKRRFTNVPQFALRDRLRRLYGEGWSPVSILVVNAGEDA